MPESNGIRPTAQQVVAEVSDLASLPEVYFRIKRLVESPTASLNDVANALATDPTIASRLLRMANSAFYGRSGSITTLSLAVGLVGTQQVRDLVLATSVIDALRTIPPGLVSLRDFWSVSLFAGSASKLIAEACNILDCERLFVAGLLAQLGELVLYMQLPQEMQAVAITVQRSGQSVRDVEREMLGFDYATVSAELLDSWQLPTELVGPIRHHTKPTSATSHHLEAAIVHIAVQLAAANEQGLSAVEVVSTLDPKTWQVVDLSVDSLDTVQTDARLLLGELGPIFLQAA